MVGPWKVQTTVFDGEKAYQIYRLVDVDKTDHSGNREYYGGLFKTKEQAQAIKITLELGDNANAKR